MMTQAPLAATHMAGPTVTAQRLAMASRSGRPPTGMRAPTAMGERPADGGVTLNPNVTVEARPVTQQGLRGMRTKALGPGRQIADKTFYINLIRNMNVDLRNECESMRKEMEQIAVDNAQYAKLDREFESKLEIVRNCEGKLADFNLAIDKVRTHTNLSEISEMHALMQQRNAAQRKQVDALFLKSTRAEKEIQEASMELNHIHQETAKKMESMGNTNYAEMQDSVQRIKMESREKEQMLQEQNRVILALQAKLESPEYKVHAKGVEALKKKKNLELTRRQLLEELKSGLSEDQLRALLKRRIADSTAELKEIQRKAADTESSIEKQQRLLSQKEQELEDAKAYAKTAKKYEAVYERERKMQTFLDAFPSMKKKQSQRKTALQRSIVAHLNHISKGIAAERQLPTAKKLQQMQSELNFKGAQLSNSKMTLGRLQDELKERKRELIKINGLDKKLSVELPALRRKIETMQKEMASFRSPEQLQEDSNNAKQELRVLKGVLAKKSDRITQQVQLLSHSYERKKRDLSSNDAVKRLENLEHKIRTHSGNVGQLEETINSHTRESEYETVSKQCNTHLREINALLVNKY